MEASAGASARGGLRTVAIRTLGCKVNTYESGQILEGLERTGQWARAREADTPDLFVVNSCTVTKEADRQTRQEIRRCVRENPNALVVVTGCYAQMDANACGGIEGVDLVVGNALKLRIADIIPRLEAGLVPRILTENDVDDLIGLPAPLLGGFDGRTRAFIQIQQGCDQGCTFCIIHRARGASCSMPAEGILAQVRRLADAGFNEFVLCGVDLGAWGQDRADSDTPDLVALMRRILALEGTFRVRLGSLDPVHITPELISLIASEPRLCAHLHISIQSGHTLILKRMKRRYDRDTLYDVVAQARAAIPDLVIGADLMAGFPTEEESHFQATLDAISDLHIVFPHVFPYSSRPGTPAARIPRQVPEAVRRQRARRLRHAGAVALAKTLESWVDRCEPVLVEFGNGSGPSAPVTAQGTAFGRLENYLPVAFRSFEGERGIWGRARITAQDGSVLHGERVR